MKRASGIKVRNGAEKKKCGRARPMRKALHQAICASAFGRRKSAGRIHPIFMGDISDNRRSAKDRRQKEKFIADRR